MFKKIIAISFVAFLTTPAYAGFSLGQTRVIFNEKEKQSSLRVLNNGDNNYYLVQSWIEDKEYRRTDDFIITPPIFKFSPESQNTLIIRPINNNFQKDRESLYYAVVKGIPASDNSVTNKISFATKNVIKLIYRPESLNVVDASGAWRKLDIKRSGKEVSLTNPTPYIINFGYFYLNKEELEIGYLLPFSSKRLNLKNYTGNNFIKFNTINDFGGASEYHTINI